MKFIAVPLSLLFIIGCTTSKYEPKNYYDKAHQDSLLASIITYVYTAPPYTLMKDRFKEQHRKFYTSQSVMSKFELAKLFVDSSGAHYYLLIRPGAKIGDQRAVGGYFKLGSDNQLIGFKEIFVTPILPKKEVMDKGTFLFEKMASGEIDDYLKMKSYVQWPNEVSTYDTTTYEWVLEKEKI